MTTFEPSLQDHQQELVPLVGSEDGVAVHPLNSTEVPEP